MTTNSTLRAKLLAATLGGQSPEQLRATLAMILKELGQSEFMPGDTPRVQAPSAEMCAVRAELKDGEVHVVMGVSAASALAFYVGLSGMLSMHLHSKDASALSDRERMFVTELGRWLASPGDDLLPTTSCLAEMALHTPHYNAMHSQFFTTLVSVVETMGKLLDEAHGNWDGWAKLTDALAKSEVPVA